MHFRIEGLAPGLNGLVVTTGRREGTRLEVLRVFNTNVVAGDRHVSSPISEGGLWIDQEYLTPCEDPNSRQYDGSNPFGKVEVIGGRSEGNLDLSFTKYDSGALSVTIQEINPHRKTVFSQNYFHDTQKVQDLLNQTVSGALDLEDLPLYLAELDTGKN